MSGGSLLYTDHMDQSELTIEDFNRYLKIYNANIDWVPHLTKLFDQLKNKSGDAMRAKNESREHAAFTILYPAQDKNALTDPPFKLLFYAQKHDGRGTRDWLAELVKVAKKDKEIKEIREELVQLGIVDPIFYIPRWRQAFLWLMDQVEGSGLEPVHPVNKNFENLVKYYGGTIVGSLFEPQFKNQIAKIPNWRTPYFFEHLIHKTYKKDELVKIRTHDIQEIRGQDASKVVNAKVSTDRNAIAGNPGF